MACGTALTALVNREELLLIEGGVISLALKLDAEPKCVAVSPNDRFVAVGFENCSIGVYDKSGALVTSFKKHHDYVSALAFSPAGDRLASGCAAKELIVWSIPDGQPLTAGLTGYHSARITCLTWSSSAVLASGSIDSTIIVWDDKIKAPKHKVTRAHAGPTAAICFVNEATLASAGADAMIKLWNV